MPENTNTEPIQFDSSKTAIIPFNKKYSHPFGNSYKPATLTQEDLNTVEDLLVSAVSGYNNSLEKDENELGIDLKKNNYRKQLVAATNSKGEKEVWVNCFCQVWDSETWKSEILHIMDGGSCFFNFKINLTTKNVFDFMVNGDA